MRSAAPDTHCKANPGKPTDSILEVLELFNPFQRKPYSARYCVMMDSTVPCDLLFDNLVPDVLVITMPLSRLPEMAEVAIAMFAPELEGSQKEPPPRRIIFSNLMDHMACEGQLQDLPRLLREMTTRDAARNEESRLLRQIATAMERTAEKLRTQLGVPALLVSPPGMLY